MVSLNQGFNFQASITPNSKIYVSSEDRKTGETEANFTVALNGAQLDQTRSLAVHSVNVPNMFKNIEAGSNTITMELSDASPVVFTIPPGFYTILELAQAVVDGYNTIVVFPELITFTYDSITGLLEFDRPVGPRTFLFSVSSPLEFSNRDIARDMLKMPIGVLGSTQTSITPVNLFPRVKQVFVDLDVVFGNYDTPSTGQQDFVIGLPVTNAFGTILSYKEDGDNNMHINFPNSKNVGFMRIRLVDRDNKEVRDMVGFDWDLTLVVDTFELP